MHLYLILLITNYVGIQSENAVAHNQIQMQTWIQILESSLTFITLSVSEWPAGRSYFVLKNSKLENSINNRSTLLYKFKP